MPVARGLSQRLISSEATVSLRVQSTQMWSIYGFSIRNRNYDLGVYASYLGTWTLRVLRVYAAVKIPKQSRLQADWHEYRTRPAKTVFFRWLNEHLQVMVMGVLSKEQPSKSCTFCIIKNFWLPRPQIKPPRPTP